MQTIGPEPRVGTNCVHCSVVFASIARVSILAPLLADPGIDFTYSSVPVLYWTLVETNAAIVCACLMTLRPLLCRWLPKVFAPYPNSDQSDLVVDQSEAADLRSTPSRQPLGSKSVVTSKTWTTTVMSKAEEEKLPHGVV